MTQLTEKVAMDDLCPSLLRVTSVSGVLLSSDNTVQLVTLDSQTCSVTPQSQYRLSSEQVSVKTRTYEVQVYSPPALLGLTVRGDNLQLLP